MGHCWGRLAAVVLAFALFVGPPASAEPFAEQPLVARALYTGAAAVANVLPVASVVYEPRCLLGYLVCKVVFATGSVLAAADQLALSGGADLDQTRAILHRGFAGDWILTGPIAAGDRAAELLPEPPPAAAHTGGGWQPPPL